MVVNRRPKRDYMIQNMGGSGMYNSGNKRSYHRSCSSFRKKDERYISLKISIHRDTMIL